MGKNFFISYTATDRAWAEWVAWQLEVAGYSTRIQAWDFRPGFNFVREMQEAARDDERTIAILSPDYMRSLYASAEWSAAFTRDPAGQDGTLLPIRVHSFKVDGLFAPIGYIDLVDCDQEKARQKLLDGVKRTRAKPTSAPGFPGKQAGTPTAPVGGQPQQAPEFPAHWPLAWNIPYKRNEFFTGRAQLLEKLRAQLVSGTVTALTQAQAIAGLGGIGKTQTAVEYAYSHRRRYRYILWVGADKAENLLTNYAALAPLLNLPNSDEKDTASVARRVRDYLAQQKDWLLIFDNADDVPSVQNYLPGGASTNGHILLTTRAQTAGSIARTIEVKELDPDEGTLLLLRRAGVLAPNAELAQATPEKRAEAEALERELGSLPLAPDQAGAYIEETHCGLSGYLALYKTHRHQLLRRRGNAIVDHPESVATTWSVSIEKVQQENPAAAELLQFCAFLDPDAIPEELISEGTQHFANELSDDFALNEAIRVLLSYSLIRRDPDEKLLSVHRLVQAVITDEMTAEARKMWVERAVKTVEGVFPRSEYETWAQCRRYLSNALLCAELIRQYQLEISEAGTLLMEVGYYLFEQVRYREAETFLQEAVRILEKALGDEHNGTAVALHMLAMIYTEQERHKEAGLIFERSLQISQKIYGSEHRETAATIYGLAHLYFSQGRFSEAESLLLQAFAMYQHVLGEEHPHTAVTLYALAVLYERQEKYEQAEEFYQRALSVREKVLGLQHPSTTRLLRSYARFLRGRGRDSEAAALEKRIDQGTPGDE